MSGDPDLAAVASLLADRARGRMLMALISGRELSASMLAEEAGVGRSTASSHLRRLVEGGLVAVRADGRHRHFRLAGPHVAAVLEQLAELAPTDPVTSLRGSNRAAHLREARTCYDHLAGRLGVGIMAGMLDRRYLVGGDGRLDPEHPGADRPASPGRDVDYRLTDAGTAFLDRLGVRISEGRRPLVRYCVDWTETRHHLAGRLGRGLRDRFVEAGWVTTGTVPRMVRVTDDGRDVVRRELGLDI
jgi:DNA-binding transcriptional ArsR family regulator